VFPVLILQLCAQPIFGLLAFLLKSTKLKKKNRSNEVGNPYKEPSTSTSSFI